MKVAIMQPYLLPYIGYFQLISAVDIFVIYDNIEFTKKGWINRNRILVNGKDDYFTIPLKKDSDFLNVNQREIADSYSKEKTKIIGKIAELYRKAPEFQTVFPLIESIFNTAEENLFDFIYNSLKTINQFLEIDTEIVVSSSLPINHDLKSEEKVIAISKALNATHYLNAIGGMDLYSPDTFRNNGLELQFLKSNRIQYQQFDCEFVPWLSIIDVLFFNSKQKVQQYLQQYTIL